jgi:DNA-binding transcriptional ArsR family regulator
VSQTTARGVDYRERLGAGPATVGDATAGFGVSKPASTKHVKVLQETGVVTRAVEGRTHVLSLERDVLSARWQSGWIASGLSGAASWTSSTST